MTLISGFGFKGEGGSVSPSPTPTNIRLGKVPVAYNGGAGTVVTFTTPFSTNNWQFVGRVYCYDSLGGEILFTIDSASRNPSGFTIVPTDNGFCEYECIDISQSYVFNLAYRLGYNTGGIFTYSSNGVPKILTLVGDETPAQVATLLTAMGDATWSFSTNGSTYNRYTAVGLNIITGLTVQNWYVFNFAYKTQYNNNDTITYTADGVLKTLVISGVQTPAQVATLLTLMGDATWTFSTDGLTYNRFTANSIYYTIAAMTIMNYYSFDLPYKTTYYKGSQFDYTSNAILKNLTLGANKNPAQVAIDLTTIGDATWSFVTDGATYNRFIALTPTNVIASLAVQNVPVFILPLALNYDAWTHFSYTSNAVPKLLNLSVLSTPTQVALDLTAIGDAPWSFFTDGLNNYFVAETISPVIASLNVVAPPVFMLPLKSVYNAGAKFDYYSNGILKTLNITDGTSPAQVASDLTAIGDANWVFSTDGSFNIYSAQSATNEITLLTVVNPYVFTLPFVANYKDGQIFSYLNNGTQKQTHTSSNTIRANVLPLLNLLGDGTWYIDSSIANNIFSVVPTGANVITDLISFLFSVQNPLIGGDMSGVSQADNGDISLVGTNVAFNEAKVGRSTDGGINFAEINITPNNYTYLTDIKYPKTNLGIGSLTPNGAFSASPVSGDNNYAKTANSGLNFTKTNYAATPTSDLIFGSWKATFSKQELLFIEQGTANYLKVSLVTAQSLRATFATLTNIQAADSWSDDGSTYNWSFGSYDFSQIKQHVAALNILSGQPKLHCTLNMSTWTDITDNMQALRLQPVHQWNEVRCNIEGGERIVYLGCKNTNGGCRIIRKNITQGTPWTVAFELLGANDRLLNFVVDWQNNLPTMWVMAFNSALSGQFLYKTTNANAVTPVFDSFDLSGIMIYSSTVNDMVSSDGIVYGVSDDQYFKIALS